MTAVSAFDPGEGWREVDIHGPDNPEFVQVDGQGKWLRGWVREVPVPPLPTEPYTVIRAHWNDPAFGDVMWLAQDGTWRYGNGDRVHTADLAEGMSGFEVLSEPRAVTAKAVLDRVRESSLIQLVIAANPRNWDAFDVIAREFGVSS